MKFYLLQHQVEDKTGVLPSVFYDFKQVKHGYYQNRIKKMKFWNYDEPAFLWLNDEYTVPLLLRDVMRWSSGKPLANILLCSSWTKKIISQLDCLPIYRFYPCKVRIGKSYKDFWIFHYLFDIFDWLDFNSSQFYLRNLGDNKTIVKFFPLGYVLNKKHISQISREQIENNLRIEPKKLVFNNIPTYDLWSLYGQHIISEKAMLLFKEAGITGIDMIPLEETEWKHLEIVMPQRHVPEKLSVV